MDTKEEPARKRQHHIEVILWCTHISKIKDIVFIDIKILNISWAPYNKGTKQFNLFYFSKLPIRYEGGRNIYMMKLLFIPKLFLWYGRTRVRS